MVKYFCFDELGIFFENSLMLFSPLTHFLNNKTIQFLRGSLSSALKTALVKIKKFFSGRSEASLCFFSLFDIRTMMPNIP